ncbi:hypothetical protein ACJ73_07760 [Blastomyces percursus]|uniref:Uncharacterized protein n=1 Tax=Blastomyces percursus TaxID=1658174 RepID=A0A1J9QXI2_9EURO|nr:hypothetical protein ACJ73_07760 [Blastomyces percursus]
MGIEMAAVEGMTSVRRPFAEVETSRPDFDHSAALTFTKSPNPHWKQGQGGNDYQASLEKNHVEIDTYEAGRPASQPQLQTHDLCSRASTNWLIEHEVEDRL